jgi:hypothetical protein
MDATTFRRYLQPSPTLRWHPWAPALVGVLALLFAFYFGARWGKDAERREFYSAMDGAYGGRVFTDYLSDAKWPGERVMNDALAIDAGVQSFVRRDEHVPAWWEAPRARLEALVLDARTYPQRKAGAVAMAEFRLRELSPANTRWQVTSGYCARRGHRMSDFNVLGDFRQSAQAYSRLLGREVRPEDLAPAVPNWICPATAPKESK